MPTAAQNCSKTAGPYPLQTPAAQHAAAKGKVPPQGEVIYHKIRSGETLSTIARKYGVTVNQIKNWNGMSSTRINAGKRLKIYK